MDKVTIYRVLWSTLKLDATNRHGLADVITLEDHKRALDAEREKVKELEAELEEYRSIAEQQGASKAVSELATLQAQLADRDAMILQMGAQAAVLAKENMAVKAQLRQVEGERDHAKKMEAVQKEVADNQTWHVQKLKDWRDTVTLALQRPGGARFEDVPEHIKALVKEHATLRQLVEAFRSSEEWGAVKAWMVEGAPTRQEGVEAAKRITKAQYEMENALVGCRQALAAQDAGKERHE